MRVIARSTLKNFWLLPGKADSASDLQAWYAHADKATWTSWAEISADYPKASWVGNDRVVFNIAQNKYRLVVKMEFAKQRIYIRFIGTHEKYDQIEDIRNI